MHTHTHTYFILPWYPYRCSLTYHFEHNFSSCGNKVPFVDLQVVSTSDCKILLAAGAGDCKFQRLQYSKMGEKNLLDVSSFILFEATGDSEADVNPAIGELNEVCTHIGEDDAMSCSYNFSDNASISEPDDYHGLKHVEGGDNYYVERASDDDDEDEDEDEEEGVVNQAWMDDEVVLPNELSGVKMAEQPQKSNVCVNPTMKLINQREQDRLFWEACLAS